MKIVYHVISRWLKHSFFRFFKVVAGAIKFPKYPLCNQKILICTSDFTVTWSGILLKIRCCFGSWYSKHFVHVAWPTVQLFQTNIHINKFPCEKIDWQNIWIKFEGEILTNYLTMPEIVKCIGNDQLYFKQFFAASSFINLLRYLVMQSNFITFANNSF